MLLLLQILPEFNSIGKTVSPFFSAIINNEINWLPQWNCTPKLFYKFENASYTLLVLALAKHANLTYPQKNVYNVIRFSKQSDYIIILLNTIVRWQYSPTDVRVK